MLGWKANPLGLDYARPTPTVFLLQLGINQNVDEAPIFASGHGVDAGLIAAAGAAVGNGLVSLGLSVAGLRVALARRRPGWALLGYWGVVASVGNLFDYVPIRTFTTGGDMGSVARGFGWSPWLVLALFGAPTLAALVWLFARVLPTTLRALFAASPGRRAAVTVLTAAAIFGFYGGLAGLLDDAPVPQRLGWWSLAVAMPAAMLIGLARLARARPA